MSHHEYFRGTDEDHWPRGAIYLDKGWRESRDYEIRMVVGSCSMALNREHLDEIVAAYNQAEARLHELQEDA